MNMNKLDLFILAAVVHRYKKNKAKWGHLNTVGMRGWSDLKVERSSLNKKMRRDESDIVKICTYGVECSGCGSRMTSEEIEGRGYRSCCPDRKIVVRGSGSNEKK